MLIHLCFIILHKGGGQFYLQRLAWFTCRPSFEMKVTVLFPIIDLRPLILDQMSEDFTRDFWKYFLMYDPRGKCRINGSKIRTWHLLKSSHKVFRFTKRTLTFPKLSLLKKQEYTICLRHGYSQLCFSKPQRDSPIAWFEIVFFSENNPTCPATSLRKKREFSKAIDNTISYLLEQPTESNGSGTANFISVGSVLARYYARGTCYTGEEYVAVGLPTVIIELGLYEYSTFGDFVPQDIVRNKSQRKKVVVRHGWRTFESGTNNGDFDVNIWVLKNSDPAQKTSLNLCQMLSNLHFHYISYRRILSSYAFHACSLKWYIWRNFKEQPTRSYFARNTPLLSKKVQTFVKILSKTCFGKAEKLGIAKVGQAIENRDNILSLLRLTIERYINALELRQYFEYPRGLLYFIVVGLLLFLMVMPIVDILLLNLDITIRLLVYPLFIAACLPFLITPYSRR